MKKEFSSLGMAAVAMLAAIGAADFSSQAGAADWPMWGGTPARNLASQEKGVPTDWDIEKKKNIKWVAELGSQTYGNVVVARGKVFVGTNNELERNPKYKGDHGVVMCFRESDGQFLWQIAHPKLPSGRVNDWPEQGVCSSPYVDGDRLYYTSNRCQIVCLDTEGFRDGENDGPYTEEKKDEQSETDADVVWILDMMDELGVFPHNLAVCSPVGFGDLLFENTSNGVDEAHLNVPSPQAPSFIAVNKKTGAVVWEDNSPGEKILHGQWSNAACGMVNGRPQAVFAGGDGWVYSFEPGTGKLIWKFDCNPKDSVYILGGRGTRSYIIATPVIFEDKVYIAVGQDPEHGEGPGHLWCIDATQTGDVTESGRVWHYGDDDFHRTLSTVAISDGLVFASDLSGYLNCLDAKTGKPYWKHDLMAAVWGSPTLADGKVLIGDEDGDVAIFAAAEEKRLLFETNMGSAVYSTPVFANGVLYISNKSKLFAIAAAR